MNIMSSFEIADLCILSSVLWVCFTFSLQNMFAYFMCYFMWHNLNYFFTDFVRVSNDAIQTGRTKFDHYMPFKMISTFVSLIHSTLATLLSFYVIVWDNRMEINNLVYINSFAYFVYDFSCCRKERMMILHHIASILIIASTLYTENKVYFAFINILMFFGEVTAIPQHIFFINRMMYGEQFKREFYTVFYKLFLGFVIAFCTLRIGVLPMVIITCLSDVKEFGYFMILIINFTGLVLGSFYWGMGQIRLLGRMGEMIGDVSRDEFLDCTSTLGHAASSVVTELERSVNELRQKDSLDMSQIKLPSNTRVKTE